MRQGVVMLVLGGLSAACSPSPRCTPGETVACYSGPKETANEGTCRPGTALCGSNGRVGECKGEVLPSVELCDGFDNDCDGQVDERVDNGCGGCGPLTESPGKPCGQCGTVVCASLESVTCSDPGTNNCGACGPQVAGLGQACTGPDGCLGSLLCADGGLTAACGAPPRNNCSRCGLPDVPGLGQACAGASGCMGTVVCDSNLDAGFRCSAPGRNNCGACGVPDVPVGSSCTNAAGCTGTLRCADGGSAGLCDGPGRNNCGACGQPNVGGLDAGCTGTNGCAGRTTCNAAGSATTCAALARNNCNACGAPDVPNLGQACSTPTCGTLTCNGAGTGSVCTPSADSDGDLVPDACDNCPSLSNPTQDNADGDGRGDACDNCPAVASTSQADFDADGRGDVCDVVVSELSAAGYGGASDEFVELYNGGPAAVDLTGWLLQYQPATTGAAWSTVLTLPSGSQIPSRGFFLITSGGRLMFGGEADLKAAAALGLDESAGAVRLGPPLLATRDAFAADALGYGTSGAAEGSPATPPAFGTFTIYSTEDFETVPAWTTTYDYAASATFTTQPNGLYNAYLQASRGSEGSSARVLVFTVPSGVRRELTVFARVPAHSGSYWVELGYRLGAQTAQDFDTNPSAWTLLRKFSNTGNFANGNGDAWTRYSVVLSTGTSTLLSFGIKVGSSGGGGPVVGFDSLRVSSVPPSLERKANAASTPTSMESGADAPLGNNQDTQNNAQDFVQRPTRQPQTSAAPPEP